MVVVKKRSERIFSSIDNRDAFRYCARLARDHYENFPVASFLLPRSKRPFVYAVYAFARTADDLADEGSLLPAARLAALDDLERRLYDCYEGKADHPVFIALGETAEKTKVPQQLLVDLLTAFRLDVTKKRFSDFRELLYYCSCSANPIGRLVLHIFGNVTARALDLSDQICTGLQLANFWQDLSLDWRKGRLYVPLDDCGRFGYTESDLAKGIVDERFRNLMRFQIDRTRQFLLGGTPLVHETSSRLKFEVILTVEGGLAILRAIETSGYDVLHNRPALSKGAKAKLLAAVLLNGRRWIHQ
ncbi:MAG: squalene synthase HpnC [Bacteroidota bacterium]